MDELNFVLEFKLSKEGMINEIKNECDIIRIAISELNALGMEYSSVTNRIMIMPIRKLLCENQGESMLLELCPSFKMPRLNGTKVELQDKLNVVFPIYKFGNEDTWISLKDWKKQRIAWFDKTAEELPNVISNLTYECVKNKLKGQDKQLFISMFDKKIESNKGKIEDSYIRKDDSKQSNLQVFELLKKAGYYDLDLYTFIKHLADKKAAHLDRANSPLYEIINGYTRARTTPITNIALQLIYAIKKQIPEMSDYWKEMDAIVEELK